MGCASLGRLVDSSIHCLYDFHQQLARRRNQRLNETQLGWETISVEVVTESETLGPGMLKAFLHLTSYMQVGGCVEVKWDYLRV